MKKLKFLTKNQQGISHILLPLVIVVLVAVVGTYLIVSSDAKSKNCKSGYVKTSQGCVRKKTYEGTYNKSNIKKMTREQLAAEILAQAARGKVTFNVLNSGDASRQTTPADNIKSTASGQKAMLTTNCSGRGGQASGKTSVYLDKNLLRYMLALSDELSYSVNSLAGQCHTKNSQHYKGKAIDFACPFDAKLPTAVRIGQTYGISHNNENCAGDGHYHFSKGGR